MISGYHLVLPKPEFVRVPTVKRECVFHDRSTTKDFRISTLTLAQLHIKSCPVYHHEIDGEDVTCTNPFSGETKLIERRPSVFSLLVASRAIYEETQYLYYSCNHFMMKNLGELRQLIYTTPAQNWLREITFKYQAMQNGNNISDRVLLDCPYLEVLHIEFHFEWVPRTGKRRPLAKSPRMENLLRVRNIQTLEICGKDWIPTKGREGREVDINHPRALGPLLRKNLMQTCTSDKRKGRCPGCPVCPTSSRHELEDARRDRQERDECFSRIQAGDGIDCYRSSGWRNRYRDDWS